MINTIIIIVAAMIIAFCLTHISYAYVVTIVAAIMKYREINLNLSKTFWVLVAAVGVLVSACLL